MNPFEHSKTIAFELSNQCNLRHEKCPRSLTSPFEEPITLPRQVVCETLANLADYGWNGAIEFHEYNEPLIDPRLFGFIEMAHELLPKCNIDIVTNGFGLSRQLAKELKEAGVSKFHVSLYGKEKERYATWLRENIAPIIPVSYGWHALDDRLTLYDDAPNKSTAPCLQPLVFLQVHSDSQLGLCCYDWKRSVEFGDLREQPLSEIVINLKTQETYRRLSGGDRFLDICQRCTRARGI